MSEEPNIEELEPVADEAAPALQWPEAVAKEIAESIEREALQYEKTLREHALAYEAANP